MVPLMENRNEVLGFAGSVDASQSFGEFQHGRFKLLVSLGPGAHQVIEQLSSFVRGQLYHQLTLSAHEIPLYNFHGK